MTTADKKQVGDTRKVIISIMAILVAVTMALMLVKSQIKPRKATATFVQVGEKVPDFKIAKFNGKESLASEHKFKVAMVSFWASWCDACMIEMPSIIKLYNSYKDKGLDVFAINIDENPETVLPRLSKEFGPSFPLYTDPNQAAADVFDLHAIPFTVIIDKNFRILFIENGERDWNSGDVRRQMEQWLSSSTLGN